MHTDAKSLKDHGDKLFGKRGALMSLWQNIAEEFYIERADFTSGRPATNVFGDHNTTSYPMMARRDLANTFSSMLRPTDKQWFFLRAVQDWRESDNALKWMEYATDVQRRAMYDSDSNFVRSTKEADNDFATFGQCVISVELNRRKQALLYRTWHLRDVAWCEGAEGKVEQIHRNWQPEARVLRQLFKDIHPSVLRLAEKEPYKEIKCRHIIIPTEDYQSGDIKKKYKTPYISMHLDVEHNHVMEEVGVTNKMYVIPRWQTVAGSQYAFSPATIAALQDARLIQEMTLTLLEAGQKAVDPPMLAVQEAIRSDISLYAGGITWTDSEYDERLGEVLRPLTQDMGGIPLGIEMQRDVRAQIAEAFFLNKIGLPPVKGDMTAFEVGQRVAEYIRNALPLFEPMEVEYNGGLCEMTFDILLQNGAFGAVDSIPDELRGADMRFKFESPLAAAQEHQKSQKFLETKAMVLEATQLDPNSRHIFDVQAALRDVLSAGVSPATWMRQQEEIDAAVEAEAQQQQAQQMMMDVAQGGMAAEQIGKAGKALQEGLGGVM